MAHAYDQGTVIDELVRVVFKMDPTGTRNRDFITSRVPWDGDYPNGSLDARR